MKHLIITSTNQMPTKLKTLHFLSACVHIILPLMAECLGHAAQDMKYFFGSSTT